MGKTLTKEMIVEEAARLLDAEGLDGLSMRKLAARLGVQAPTLYYHVPDKAALMNELLVLLFERCFAIMPPVSTWQDWMREFGRAIWRVQQESPSAPLLIMKTKRDEAHFERKVRGLRERLAVFEGDQEELMFIQSAVQAVVTGWSIFAASGYPGTNARIRNFEEQAMRSVDAVVRGSEQVER